MDLLMIIAAAHNELQPLIEHHYGLAVEGGKQNFYGLGWTWICQTCFLVSVRLETRIEDPVREQTSGSASYLGLACDSQIHERPVCYCRKHRCKDIRSQYAQPGVNSGVFEAHNSGSYQLCLYGHVRARCTSKRVWRLSVLANSKQCECMSSVSTRNTVQDMSQCF